MTDWIDPSCKFGDGIALADLKALLPPAVVMQDGYACTNKQWDNLTLASQHTALFGILFELLDTQFSNADAIQCLWDGPFCGLFADRFFADFANGDPAVITLPAGGTWRGAVFGYGDITTNSFTPNVIGNVDEATNSVGKVWGGTVAGGAQFGGSANLGNTLSVAGLFVRVDC